MLFYHFIKLAPWVLSFGAYTYFCITLYPLRAENQTLVVLTVVLFLFTIILGYFQNKRSWIKFFLFTLIQLDVTVVTLFFTMDAFYSIPIIHTLANRPDPYFLYILLHVFIILFNVLRKKYGISLDEYMVCMVLLFSSPLYRLSSSEFQFFPLFGILAPVIFAPVDLETQKNVLGKNNTYILLFLSTIILLFISGWYSYHVYPSIAKAMDIAGYGMVFYWFYKHGRSRQRGLTMCLLVAYCLGCLGVIKFFQELVYMGMFKAFHTRIFVSGVAHNPIAIYLVLILPLLAVKLITSPSRVYKVVTGLHLAMLTFILFLTYSRGAWVGLAVALVILFLSGYKNSTKSMPKFLSRYVVVGIICMLVLIILFVFVKPVRDRLTILTDPIYSIKPRLLLWKIATREIIDNPFLGTGMDTHFIHATYVSVNELPIVIKYGKMFSTHIHNFVIELMKGAGIPVTIIFLTMLVIFFRDVIKNKPNISGNDRTLQVALVAGMVAVIVRGLTGYVIWFPAYGYAFFSFMGTVLSMQCSHLEHTEKKYLGQVFLRIAGTILVIFLFIIPMLGRSYLARGKFYRKTEHWDKARDMFKKGKLFSLKDSAFPRFEADMHLVRYQYEDAMTAVKESIKLNPRFAQFYSVLGWIQLVSGDREKAYSSFQKATKLDPCGIFDGDKFVFAALTSPVDDPNLAKNYLKKAVIIDSMSVRKSYWFQFKTVNNEQKKVLDPFIYSSSLKDNMTEIKKRAHYWLKTRYYHPGLFKSYPVKPNLKNHHQFIYLGDILKSLLVDIQNEKDGKKKTFLEEKLRFASFELLMDKRKYFENTRRKLVKEGINLPKTENMISLPSFVGLDRQAIIRIRLDYLSYYGYGLFLAQNGEKEKAVNAFQQVNKLYDKMKTSINWRRTTTKTNTHMTPVLKLEGGKKLAFVKENPLLLKRMASVAESMGNPKLAFQYLLKSLKLELSLRNNLALNPVLKEIGKQMSVIKNSQDIPMDTMVDKIRGSVSVPWAITAREVTLAYLYWYSGLKDLCVTHMKNLVKSEPLNPGLHVVLADFMYENQQVDDAIQYYLEAINLDPNSVNPGILRALVYAGNHMVNVGKFNEGISLLEYAAEKNPNSSWIVDNLENAYLYRKSYNETLQRLKNKKYSDYMFNIELANTLMENKLFKLSLDVLAKLKLKYPNDTCLDETMAKVYLKAGYPSKTAETLFKISVNLFQSENYVTALEKLFQAINIDLEHNAYECANPRLFLYAEKLINLQPYIPPIKDLSQIKPLTGKFKKVPACLVLKGYILKQLSLLKKAENCFREAVSYTSNNGSAQHVLGKFYKDTKQLGKAVNAFQLAIKMENNSSKPYNLASHIWLGDILLKQRKINQAVELYKWVKNKKPSLGWARRALANAYMESKKYMTAVNELETFFTQYPGEKEGHFLLGRAYLNLGKLPEARSEFIKCLSYFPKHEYAEKYLAKINKLMGLNTNKTP